jgi:hypothetical protein
MRRAESAEPAASTADEPFHYPINTIIPDAYAQKAMRQQQQEQHNFEVADAELRRQITDDSSKLLKLATGLKAEGTGPTQTCSR